MPCHQAQKLINKYDPHVEEQHDGKLKLFTAMSFKELLEYLVAHLWANLFEFIIKASFSIEVFLVEHLLGVFIVEYLYISHMAGDRSRAYTHGRSSCRVRIWQETDQELILVKFRKFSM